ncbi:MAG: DUF2807 domain-containing protein [Bacteroidia bacterium]|nr:DUF2807 domain-containing protein [Bacteroidia bacterium]
MKKTSILFLTLFILGLTSYAQNGSVRALADFSVIEFNGTGNIVINQGTVAGVRLTGNENTFDKAVIEVVDNELQIDKLGKNTAYITFVNINRIEQSGTGSIKGEGLINAETLKIENSGAGRSELEIQSTDVSVELSGVGSVSLSGAANKLNADISGTGSIKASDLIVSKANANISGIGSLHIDVRDELAVDISGNGSVKYVTPPKVINKDISGLGKVGDKKTTGGGDTTKITIGDSEIIIIDKKDTSDYGLEEKIAKRKSKNSVRPFWGGFEMGFNGYLNADNKTSMPEGYEFLELNESKSLAVNINFFSTKIKLQKDHLWVVTGMGLAYNNYRFSKRNFKLVPEADSITIDINPMDPYNFDKSKLVATYATVPVLLQVNTSKSKRNNVHLSTGGIFAYKIGSHTKYLTKNGSRKKEKERDDFNLEPIRLDATVRVGYKNFNIFANYAVTELFKDGEGPELHPYTIGLTIIGW